MLTDESNFHLTTMEGTTLPVARRIADTYVFNIPFGVDEVYLRSRTSRPCDVIGPFVDDRRRLGILVGEITLVTPAGSRQVDTHLTQQDLPGWDVLETSPCRWTNGHASLPLGGRLFLDPAVLAVQVVVAGPYVLAQDFEPEAVMA